MTVIAPAPVSPPRTRPAWGPGRVIVLVVGVLLVLGAAALLVGGASLRDIDTSEREDGYLTSDGTDATTSGFALASDAIHLDALPEGWLFGDSRLQVTADDPDHSLFVGIARPDDAAAYLQDIEHTTVTEIDNVAYDHHQGGPPTRSSGRQRHLGCPGDRRRSPVGLLAVRRPLDPRGHEQRLERRRRRQCPVPGEGAAPR
jgi:hypothetical protein